MKRILPALLWLLAAPAFAQDPAHKAPAFGNYPLTADSQVQPGIRHGELKGPFEFTSQVFPGTVRQYWVYVPAGYDAKTPPNLLVFQDGQRATSDRDLRIPTVLDNLIAKGDIPPTLAVFITPGNVSAHYPDNLGLDNPNHRREEYDAISDVYTRFLLDEMLPQVAKTYAFTNDPKRRAIGGTSSGAICAFTVAWRRPDAFGTVLSAVGSFDAIGWMPATADHAEVQGGDVYPAMIRRAPPKPLRIFLQDGANDLDNEFGNWFLGNQQMLSALNWANSNADAKTLAGPRYELAHVWGDGPHSDAHAAALMPDMLRFAFGATKSH